MASVKAKPSIAVRNKSSLIKGLTAVDNNNPAKTIPIPNPHPAKPVVLNPAPNFCAAVTKYITQVNNIKILKTIFILSSNN